MTAAPNKALYAIRAMVALAADWPASAATSAIAARATIPAKYLELILGDLRRAGLVASQRGRAGGHRLARRPGEIRVGEIVRAVAGAGTATPGHDSTARLWRRAEAAFRAVLDEAHLDDLRASAAASEFTI